MTKTILIVEDEHILREIMKDYFSNEGYNVLEESVKVCIENTGVYIPSEKIEKIWDRFYRGEASRHRSTGGTGLGLAISKKILELHEVDYGACNTTDGVLFFFNLKKSNS